MVLLKVKYINVFKNFRETAKTGFYFAAKGVRKASVLSERIKLTYVHMYRYAFLRGASRP